MAPSHRVLLVSLFHRLLLPLLLAATSLVAALSNSLVPPAASALAPPALAKRDAGHQHIFVPVGPIRHDPAVIRGAPLCGLWVGGWAIGSVGTFYRADPSTRRFEAIPNVALPTRGAPHGPMLDQPRANHLLGDVALAPLDGGGSAASDTASQHEFASWAAARAAHGELRRWCAEAAHELIGAWRRAGVAAPPQLDAGTKALLAVGAVGGGALMTAAAARVALRHRRAGLLRAGSGPLQRERLGGGNGYIGAYRPRRAPGATGRTAADRVTDIELAAPPDRD